MVRWQFSGSLSETRRFGSLTDHISQDQVVSPRRSCRSREKRFKRDTLNPMWRGQLRCWPGVSWGRGLKSLVGESRLRGCFRDYAFGGDTDFGPSWIESLPNPYTARWQHAGSHFEVDGKAFSRTFVPKLCKAIQEGHSQPRVAWSAPVRRNAWPGVSWGR